VYSNSATIEIAKPKVFTMGAVVAVNAYGLLLVAPLLLSILAISLLTFSLLTILIPFLVMVATAYLLPFGLGNTHIARLVRSISSDAVEGETFVVQLTLSPRIRTGLRAVLEDADDIGYLTFTSAGLRFRGDSVTLSVPFDRIAKVQPQNVGLRGSFVYGRRIKVVVSGLPRVESFEFAERTSWLLPKSRAITRSLCQRLSTKAPQPTSHTVSSDATY